MPVINDCAFPSEQKRKEVFNRVARENPDKNVKFMHGPYGRVSITRDDDFIMNEYKDNPNDHPEGTEFVYTEGVGFALEPIDKRQKVFERVASKHPTKTVKFMHDLLIIPVDQVNVILSCVII